MSIPFNEIEMPAKPLTKEQIVAEVKRTWKPSRDMKFSYFYDGNSRGEISHELLTDMDDAINDASLFEDVPF
jgi:hypothetical protein